MSLFPMAHAAHADWRVAVREVAQRLRACLAAAWLARRPRLGLVYCTHDYAADAGALLSLLARELPQVSDWAGCSAPGVLAGERAYLRQGALAVMLLDLPAAHYRLYSGLVPLGQMGDEAGFIAEQALVHADGQVPELAELLQELSVRTSGGALVGGVGASQGGGVQFALRAEDFRSQRAGPAAGVLRGGLSGVAWTRAVASAARLAHGCKPVSSALAVTAAEGALVTELDGQPALTVLLRALGIAPADGWRGAVEQLRSTFAALAPPGQGLRREALGPLARVQGIVGIDPRQLGIALSAPVEPGAQLIFCRPDAPAARRGLMEVGAALRDALAPELPRPSLASGPACPWTGSAEGEPSCIRGAIYVSSLERGELFGGLDVELRTLSHALGKVPVIGFVAEPPIMQAGLQRLAGVLTVFPEVEGIQKE